MRTASAVIGCTLLVALSCSVTHAAIYTWYAYNGHQYAITEDYNTWAGAEVEAEAAGGHLVTISDAAENAWLVEQFKGYYSEGYIGNPWASYVWIGLHGIPDDLVWANGEPVTFVAPIYPGWGGDWCPRSGGGTEFGYLHTATHPNAGTWANAGNNVRGIIELDNAVPEPTASLSGRCWVWSLSPSAGGESGRPLSSRLE